MQPGASEPPAGAVPEPRPSRSRIVLLVGVIAAVLILAGVGVYLAYFAHPTPAPNTPPTVQAILMSPSAGNVSTRFAFTARVSDVQDPSSAIQVRWDWQGDGVWDTNWSTDKNGTHVFPQTGTDTVVLEAMDTRNLTANGTRIVTVYRSTLVYDEMSEPVTVDPSDAYDLWSWVALQNTYDTLVGFDRDQTQIVPELATSWAVSPSGLNWTFTLRQGVRFCDGNPMTAQDVYASFGKVLVENSPMSGVSWILSQSLDPNNLPGSLWVKDASTIQMNLTSPVLGGKPYAGFLSTLAMVEPVGIMEGAWIQAHGGVQPGTPNSYIMQNTMGTAAYCLASSDWVRGSQMTLRQNPYYWRGWHGNEPTTIVIRFTDATTRVQAIQTHAADLADLPLSLLGSVAGYPGVVLSANNSIDSEIVAMNVANPFLADNASGRLVRQAFSTAFDYNATIAQDFAGYANLLPGPIPNGLPYFDVQHQVYWTNVPKASQLLNQSGYTLNAQGWRFGGYVFRIVVDGTQLEETNAARRWQATLLSLGVQSQLLIMPSTDQWDAVRQQGAYEFFFGHWILDYPDPDDYVTPMVMSLAYGGDYWNTGFDNLTINSYGLAARSELSTPARSTDYAQVFAAATANPNMIWACQRAYVVVRQTYVGGFWFNPVTEYNFYFYSLT